MTTSVLTTRDIEFFDDVRALMKNKYPEMERKFGLWRIHQHFELGEDELFYETSDAEKKESTLKIIKKRDLPENAKECSWRLSSPAPIGAPGAHNYVVEVRCGMGDEVCFHGDS